MQRRRSSVPLLTISILLWFDAPAAGRLLSIGPNSSVMELNPSTGVAIGVLVPAGTGGIQGISELAIGPDGLLYVSVTGGAHANSVFRFDRHTGDFVDKFAFGGGLNLPLGLAWGSDGHLLVSSYWTGSVLKYDGLTGALIGTFASGGGLAGSHGLGFGPDGHLYVAGNLSQGVYRYNGLTGAPMGLFSVGGGLAAPIDVEWGSDGNLYVTSDVAVGRVLRYQGASGAFMGDFIVPGAGGLTRPQELQFGPDGALYVDRGVGGRILRYDGQTGAFIDTFAQQFSARFIFFDDVVVPEPSVLFFVSTALAGALIRQRRRRALDRRPV